MTSKARRVCGMGLTLVLAGANVANAGFPWVSKQTEAEKELEWSLHANDPISTRQVYKYGKHWPPYERPIGPEAKLIHRFHAAHYWPYPYTQEDQAFVREMSRLHVESGWMTVTTLYEYHFDAHSHELNRSGKLKVRWIVHNAPEQFCKIFVQSTESVDTNNARLESTRLALAGIATGGPVPHVSLLYTEPLGRPATEIDRIRRAELDSQPTPRIPYKGASGGATQGP